MRVILLIFLLFSLSFGQKSTEKTKKYRCVQLADDEEIQIVKKKTIKGVKTYSREKSVSQEIDRPFSRVPNSRSAESIEVPHAKVAYRGARPRTITTTAPPPQIQETTPPDYPKEVKRDKMGRPLVLRPEHCQQMKKYATMYGVQDVITWVKNNCRMAQMFVPGATCEDINSLVASCYINKYL